MYLTWYERKLLARFHVRIGPNRAGPGPLQPIADAVKAVFKGRDHSRPRRQMVYLIALALALVPALIIWAVIPLGKGFPAVADVPIGFLWILAVAGIESYGVILAGWSSNNNFSLLGALRSSAQMISYEPPLGFFLLSILLLAGDFSLVNLVESGRQWWEWLWLWPRVPLFFICIPGGDEPQPFDLPETENELGPVSRPSMAASSLRFLLHGRVHQHDHHERDHGDVVLWRLRALPFGIGSDFLPILGPFILAGKIIVLLFLFIWVRQPGPPAL